MTFRSELPARAEDAAPVIAGLPAAEEPDAQDWRSGPLSGPVRGVPVRNFGVVAPGCLYRSAQPGDDADYEWLVEQGFGGIVCLRGEGHDCAERAAWLKERGVAYLHLPIVNDSVPTDEQARAFLKFAEDPDHWPVLVHCKDGIGRAGVMTALARYSLDGWPMDRAMREAKRYRPFRFPFFGSQRRFLNRWKDRFPAGEARVAPPAKTAPAAAAASG